MNGRNSEEIEVVSASHNSHSLIFLDMYTNYSVAILAFNPAGEGPRSDSVSVKTLQVGYTLKPLMRILPNYNVLFRVFPALLKSLASARSR